LHVLDVCALNFACDLYGRKFYSLLLIGEFPWRSKISVAFCWIADALRAYRAQSSRLAAERRLEDVAARHHFEVSVQGDRLANPSSNNPGMAAGRRERSAAVAAPGARRGGTRLRGPPLKLYMPLIEAGVSVKGPLDERHTHLLLLMPMHLTVCEDMKAWGRDSGVLQDAALLPALLKPYFRMPLDRLTIGVRLF
jgi:hypothetical protein